MARRPVPAEQPEQHVGHATDAPSTEWDARLEVIIVIALGLTAVVTALSVYLNEHQEHDANRDFHQAVTSLVAAVDVGIRTPEGRVLEHRSERLSLTADDHLDKASVYTIAEVVLATSLFLIGIAGISRRWRIKVASLCTAGGIFITALVVLATA